MKDEKYKEIWKAFKEERLLMALSGACIVQNGTDKLISESVSMLEGEIKELRKIIRGDDE